MTDEKDDIVIFKDRWSMDRRAAFVHHEKQYLTQKARFVFVRWKNGAWCKRRMAARIRPGGQSLL